VSRTAVGGARRRVAMKERDGRMGIGTARAAGIGQGIIRTQMRILWGVDRKEVDRILFVVPKRISGRVGGLGGG
jgi:hypothetical protein